MNPLFWPKVNYVVRTMLRPLAPVLHVDLQPRVNGEFTVDLDDERALRLAANPTSFMAKVLFFQGAAGYEPATFDVFRRLAPQSSLFFDVGANIGYFSLVAHAFNPDLRVASFEPLPGAYQYLTRNVRLNAPNGIRAFNLALSSERGAATFSFAIDPTFRDVEHHLTSTGGLAHDGDDDPAHVRSFNVQTETLDHLAATEFEGDTVDLVKIDVEGAEDRVLHGASTVLSEHRPFIVCEVLPGRIEQRIEDVLRSHDYRFFRISPSGVREAEHLAPSGTDHRNHLMVPDERLDAVAAWVHPR